MACCSVSNSPHVPDILPTDTLSRVGLEFGRPPVKFRDKLFFRQARVIVGRIETGPQAVREFFAFGR